MRPTHLLTLLSAILPSLLLASPVMAHHHDEPKSGLDALALEDDEDLDDEDLEDDLDEDLDEDADDQQVYDDFKEDLRGESPSEELEAWKSYLEVYLALSSGWRLKLE